MPQPTTPTTRLSRNVPPPPFPIALSPQRRLFSTSIAASAAIARSCTAHRERSPAVPRATHKHRDGIHNIHHQRRNPRARIQSRPVPMQHRRKIPRHSAERAPQPHEHLQLAPIPGVHHPMRPNRQHRRGHRHRRQHPQMRNQLPIHPQRCFRHKHIYRNPLSAQN